VRPKRLNGSSSGIFGIGGTLFSGNRDRLIRPTTSHNIALTRDSLCCSARKFSHQSLTLLTKQFATLGSHAALTIPWPGRPLIPPGQALWLLSNRRELQRIRDSIVYSGPSRITWAEHYASEWE
jgi:hypothetical protein